MFKDFYGKVINIDALCCCFVSLSKSSWNCNVLIAVEIIYIRVYSVTTGVQPYYKFLINMESKYRNDPKFSDRYA